eukprot:4933729-Ditylum_brightwellii.AAC.1
MEGISEATEVNGTKGLAVMSIHTIVEKCRGAFEGYAPEVIDHRNANNPYQSHYDDQWIEKIKESTHVKKFVSIHLLVSHMYEETKIAFLGTQHQDDLYFYHNALSLMTSKEIMQWMESKNIVKHWILPEQGLNKGTKY